MVFGSCAHLKCKSVACSSPGWVKPETIKLVFVASPLNIQCKEVRAMTGLLRIRIMYSEWSDMSTRGLLFQGASTIFPIQLICLV